MPDSWIPEEFPKGWEYASIGSVCQKTRLRDPSKTPDAEFEYVDVSSVSNESFTITSSTTTLGAAAPSRARKAMEAGDVLYATVRPYLKRVAMVPEQLNGQIASTGFCVVRADRKKAEPRFLYYLLLTDQVNNRIKDLQRGATYPAVSDKEVLSQMVPLPPLPEQHSIAAALLKVQEAIAAQQEVIDQTRELKKALMAKLFIEGLHGEKIKETEIGPVPESWEVKCVSECCILIVDCPHSTPKFIDDGVRVVRNVNLKDGFLLDNPAFFVSEEDYLIRTKRAILKEDDLIFSREAPVGEAGLVPPDTRLCLGQRMMQFRTNKNMLIPRFFVYSIYSESIRKRLLALASGVTAQHINVADMKSFKIPVPTISEQNQIVEAILALDFAIFGKQRKKEVLIDLFKTMLHELMTGRIPTTPLMEV